MNNFVAGGCSFTRGNELSDDTLRKGKSPSNKTWAKGLSDLVQGNYFCTANYGVGTATYGVGTGWLLVFVFGCAAHLEM